MSEEKTHCHFCGARLLGDEGRCRRCGEWLHRPPPDLPLPRFTQKEFSHAQPVWHFVLLNFLSLGLYEIPWFYRNWKRIKELRKLKVTPLLRAVFAPLFAYSLFKNMLKLAKENGYQQKDSPGSLAVAYVFLSLLWRLPDPYWLVSLASILPLIPVTRAMNHYWRVKQPDLSVRTSFSGGEIAFLAVGGIIWILVLAGLLIPQ